jgi:hypothetical protein
MIHLTRGKPPIWNHFSRTLKQNMDHSLVKGYAPAKSSTAQAFAPCGTSLLLKFIELSATLTFG